MTGDAAVKGIRELDKNGSIAMLSRETHPPYARPPLTKGLWKNTPEEKIWKHTEDQNVTLMLNVNVTGLNEDKSVSFEPKGKIYYEKLLLATGGSPRKPQFDYSGIIYYRTYDDYKKLRDLAEHTENFTIIGGGFIGSEIAAALAMNGKKVTMVFPEKYICSRIFPAELAEYVTGYFKENGVEMVVNDKIISIKSTGSGAELKTGNDLIISADAVIAGLGIKPETGLAEAFGIKVENGINVDEMLITNKPDIYSAGDAANFYNPLLDKRIRVEHEDNANKMGKSAGRNMAGAKEPYSYLPFFYSDLFDLGYEAVGELDSSMETFEDWKEKNKEGVIYYMKDGFVKGVLLWNVWKQLDSARKIIGEKKQYEKENLKGMLPG